MKINLYEKSYHKSLFLKEVSRKLKLETEVIQKDIFQSKELMSGTIMARAFKPLPIVLELVYENFSSYKNLILFMGKNGKNVLAVSREEIMGKIQRGPWEKIWEKIRGIFGRNLGKLKLQVQKAALGKNLGKNCFVSSKSFSCTGWLYQQRVSYVWCFSNCTRHSKNSMRPTISRKTTPLLNFGFCIRNSLRSTSIRTW